MSSPGASRDDPIPISLVAHQVFCPRRAWLEAALSLTTSPTTADVCACRRSSRATATESSSASLSWSGGRRSWCVSGRRSRRSLTLRSTPCSSAIWAPCRATSTAGSTSSGAAGRSPTTVCLSSDAGPASGPVTRLPRSSARATDARSGWGLMRVRSLRDASRRPRLNVWRQVCAPVSSVETQLQRLPGAAFIEGGSRWTRAPTAGTVAAPSWRCLH